MFVHPPASNRAPSADDAAGGPIAQARADRHDAATEVLRAASGLGDPEAMAALGRRLLAGREAPLRPAEALPLISRAAALGHGEANALQATLTAAGARGPADFERALDHLAQAARAGATGAQGQLRVLAGTKEGDDWDAFRAAVSVPGWLSPPRRQVLTDTSRLRVIPGFVPPPVCDWLIARARPLLRGAAVYGLQDGGAQRQGARSNSVAEFDIVEADLVMMLVRARIAVATGLPPPAMEPPQVLHYAVGQRFERHFDFLDPAMPAYAADLEQRGQRILTFLLYLNSDYEGGETEFPLLDIRHRGAAGDALFFANVDRQQRIDRDTLHAGAAPTAGEKWLLSQWIRNRPQP